MAAERSMDPILLVGSVIVLAAALTWILPAGRFERVRDSSGRTLVVPGSYKNVPRTPVGPWGVLTSAPDGLIEAADVVFYVFLAGAALTVVEATGAIGGTIDRLARRFAKRPILILILASLLFLVGGASYSMYEETIAFIPLLAALTRRLGIPGEVAVGISVGTSSIAQNFSPVDTFHLGIGQRMAELPLFSGAAFRSVVFVLAIAIWGGYLAWYARRFRGAPRLAEADAVAGLRQRPRYADAAVLATLNAGIVALLLGAIFLHWELRHFAAVFVGVGWVAGLAGGLGWRGTAEQFA